MIKSRVIIFFGKPEYEPNKNAADFSIKLTCLSSESDKIVTSACFILESISDLISIASRHES